MKRFGYLYEKIYDVDNIKLAHKNARKGKLHYKEVQMVDNNLDEYAEKLHVLLKEKKFKNSKYVVFKKKTDNGKIREIYKLPYFPDRIVHHAIMQIIEPIWKPTLIRDTFSSIKGRGVHDGIRRITKALNDNEGTRYCLKLDISKYYPSIPNDILKQVIRKKIKDNDLLQLLDEIINSTKGVPIGNYLSQYFGNLYLSSLDHKIKKDFKYYYRYCDDIIILHKCKNTLHILRETIQDYLSAFFKLNLKPNWQIFPTAIRGIDFLGYRHFHQFRLLRKSIKYKFIRLIRMIKQKRIAGPRAVNSLMSYKGWIIHGDCMILSLKYIDNQIKNAFSKICISNRIKNPIYKFNLL